MQLSCIYPPRLTIIVVVALLAACAQTPHQPPQDRHEQVPARPIGGDRDAHGCPTSAGYRWCERSRQCERPWELAASVGFENTAEGFDTWCAAKDAAASP